MGEACEGDSFSEKKGKRYNRGYVRIMNMNMSGECPDIV